jgi:hypothetical protein
LIGDLGADAIATENAYLEGSFHDDRDAGESGVRGNQDTAAGAAAV